MPTKTPARKPKCVSWISMSHAAQLIGISDRCVRYAIARGQVKAKKDSHGYWLISMASAAAYRDDPEVAGKRKDAKAVAARVKRRARDAARNKARAWSAKRRLKARRSKA